MAKILVAPGHGIRPNGSFDPGAIDPKSKVWEHDLNIIVTETVHGRLTALGHSVTLEKAGASGRKAHDPNWVGTLKTANMGNFNLAIEIHHDTYLAPNKGFGIIPRKNNLTIKELCHTITAAYSAQGLPTKASYIDVRGLGFLRGSKTPMLIWEAGSTVAYSKNVAAMRGIAIADGIHNWTKKK